MPGSPESRTDLALARPRPRQRSSSRPSSCSRPTSGVRPSACSASNRPSAAPSPSDGAGAHGLGEALQRRRGRGRGNRTGRRAAGGWPRRRRPSPVPPAACSRAARFGVSPTTASSRAEPSPISSPTTTEPGRDADPAGQRLAVGVASAPTAATRPSPARTARSARPRAPAASRNRPARRRPGTWRRGRRSGRSRRRRRSERRACTLAHLLGVEPAASAVEPTRSTNITVSWRRSAPVATGDGSAAFGGAARSRGSPLGPPCAARAAGRARAGRPRSAPQDVGRELGVAERLRVALKPEPAQPGRDVHVGPTRCRRAGELSLKAQFALAVGIGRAAAGARFSRHLARGPAPRFVASRDSSAGSASRRR